MYDAKMEELRPLFTCTLCEQIFVEPVRLKRCGHIFCHFCLVKHLKKSPTCAQCNQSLDSVGHRNYSNDLQLQELSYRCFPTQTVTAMRRKFEFLCTKKSIIYQLCAANIVYLLQHHILPGKVRLKIRLNAKYQDSCKKTDSIEMIIRCEHDIPIGSIKKLFARKFQLPISCLNLYSSDSLTLHDDDTVSEMVLKSGGFDVQTPILILANFSEDSIEENLMLIDDEMPVLEAESYEFDAPSPIIPILEAALPTTSAQEIEQKDEIKEKIVPVIEQQPIKRKITSFDNESKPPKIRKSKSDITPKQPSQQDLISYFNALNSTKQLNSIPQIPSPSSSIFQTPSSPFPFMPPNIPASCLQMFNQSAAMRQPSNFLPNIFPHFSPQLTQQSPNPTNSPNIPTQKDVYDFWMRFFQMSGQLPMQKVKKPGATVKPMRRSDNKPTPTTPTDNRTNKTDTLLDNYETNETSREGDEHLRKLLSCSKI